MYGHGWTRGSTNLYDHILRGILRSGTTGTSIICLCRWFWNRPSYYYYTFIHLLFFCTFIPTDIRISSLIWPQFRMAEIPRCVYYWFLLITINSSRHKIQNEPDWEKKKTIYSGLGLLSWGHVHCPRQMEHSIMVCQPEWIGPVQVILEKLCNGYKCILDISAWNWWRCRIISSVFSVAAATVVR